MKFIKLLPKTLEKQSFSGPKKSERFFREFKLLVKKRLNTEYLYPNKNTAFRILKNYMKLWFNVKLGKKAEEKLRILIDKHKINNKIKFEEKIWFYVLKLK